MHAEWSGDCHACPSAPQRPLHARLQCEGAGEGRDAAGGRADSRPRGFGRAGRQGDGAQAGRRGGQGRFRRAGSRHPGERPAHALGADRPHRRRRRRPRRHSPAQGRRPGRDHARRPHHARQRRPGEDPALGDDGDAERDPQRRPDRRRRGGFDLAARGAGHGPQRSRQGDARPADPRPSHHDGLSRQLRRRRPGPRGRHHRRRLQRHQGPRRLPRRMPAGPGHGPRRQDADPSGPDRHLQRGLRTDRGRGRERPRDHRRLRPAGKPGQGSDPAQRQDGRAPARRDGAPDLGDRRGDRRFGQGCARGCGGEAFPG